VWGAIFGLFLQNVHGLNNFPCTTVQACDKKQFYDSLSGFVLVVAGVRRGELDRRCLTDTGLKSIDTTQMITKHVLKHQHKCNWIDYTLKMLHLNENTKSRHPNLFTKNSEFFVDHAFAAIINYG
jgi:hypothetical protein